MALLESTEKRLQLFRGNVGDWWNSLQSSCSKLYKTVIIIIIIIIITKVIYCPPYYDPERPALQSQLKQEKLNESEC